MSPRSIVPVLALVLAAWPVAAQESATAAQATDSQPPQKKKGVFGKLKSVAGNKTVQSVAKVAACTMVPGGQFVAAGIDAASSAAAGSATGAVQGAAGAATGSACFGGAPGGGVAGAAGTAAMGAGAVLGATGMGAGMPSMAQPGGNPGAAPLSPKDEKQMRGMMKKQGMTDEQINSTLATYRQYQQGQAAAPDGSRSGGQENFPATAPGAGSQPVGLPDDYDSQLKAGKLVLIDLPWNGTSAEFVAGTEDGVRISFVRIVESIRSNPGTYRVSVYVAETDRGVAQARAKAVIVFLTDAGLSAGERLGGKTTVAAGSKQPRIELVRN